MNTTKLNELRKKGYHLDPIVRVGKQGLTDSIISEIKDQLKKKQLIKVKLLKSALETGIKAEFFDDLVRRTDSVLVHKVGFTIVLARTEMSQRSPKTI